MFGKARVCGVQGAPLDTSKMGKDGARWGLRNGRSKAQVKVGFLLKDLDLREALGGL